MTCCEQFKFLNQELLDGVLELLDLILELRAFVCRDRRCDHGTGDAARTPKRLLVRHEDVRDVLWDEQQGASAQLARFHIFEGGRVERRGDGAGARVG